MASSNTPSEYESNDRDSVVQFLGLTDLRPTTS